MAGQTQSLNFDGIPAAGVRGAGAANPATSATSGLNFSGIPDAAARTKPSGLTLPDMSQGAANPDAPDEDVIVSNLKSAGRMIRGAARGAISTVQGLTAPIRRAVGMEPATPVQPETTTAGTIGRTGEQVAEFLIPSGIASKYATVINAANKLRAAGLTARAATLLGSLPEAILQATGAYAWTRAQGGTAPGTAAAVAGAMPVVGAVADVAVPALLRSAKQGVARVLRPGLTPKEMDAPEAPRLLANAASEALDQGLAKTWNGWRSAAALERRGQGQALQSLLASPAGDQRLPMQPILDAVDDFVQSNAKHLIAIQKAGKSTGQLAEITRPTAQARTIVRLAREFRNGLRQYGDTIEARQMVDLKRAWDTAVRTTKADAPLLNVGDRLVAVDKAMYNVAANSVREVLSSNTPTIAAINKSTEQAIKLHQILKRAARSVSGVTTAQQITKEVVRSAPGVVFGAAAGYREKGVVGALVGGVLGGVVENRLAAVLTSPGFKLAPAATKQALAEAIVSGRTDQILRIITPLLTGVASRSGATTPAAGTAGAAGFAVPPPAATAQTPTAPAAP